MDIKGIKKKQCKICSRIIPDIHDYCAIHRNKEVQKIHESFKKINQGKTYAEYLKEDARRK